MEYFLHSSLFLELISGVNDSRLKIESYLHTLLTKNHILSTSSISLFDLLLSPRMNPKNKTQIIQEITILTDKIYSLNTLEINQGVKFLSEYSIPLNSAIDLAICFNHNVNKILYSNTDFQTQKLISSTRIV